MLVMLAFPGIFQNRQIIAQSLRLVMLAVFLRLDFVSANPWFYKKTTLATQKENVMLKVIRNKGSS